MKNVGRAIGGIYPAYCGVQVVCLFFFSAMGAVNVWKTNSHILTGLYN